MLFTSIAVVAIQILIPGQQILAQTNSSSTFLTYRDPIFGYSIEYPSNWNVSYIGSEPSLTIISSAGDTARVFINVNTSGSMTMDDLGNRIKRAVANSSNPSVNASLSGINTDDYSLLGHHAIRAEGTSKSLAEILRKSIILETIINGKLYIISMNAPVAKFPDYAAIFRQMLFSFKLNG